MARARLFLILLSYSTFSPLGTAQDNTTTLSGTVIGDMLAIENARVMLVNPQSRQELVSETDANGSFSIPRVPAGFYHLVVVGPPEWRAWLRAITLPTDPVDVQLDLAGRGAGGPPLLPGR